MDKPLSDKDKKASEQRPATEAKPKVDFSQVDIGAYAGNNYNPTDLSQQSWVESRQAWKASAEGRLAIRLFSRGIMGAAFFTAGGLLNRKWMHSGQEEIANHFGSKYDQTLPLLKQKNPLQFIAKLIDNVVGKPIELVVTAFAGEEMGKRAVRFRPTKFKDAEYTLYNETQRFIHKNQKLENIAPPKPRYYRGRSLGNETVAVTFDFFCASIGDALGRDIADWFDPHVKKAWFKDGHIDYTALAKSMVKSTWQYITYNGGEDWAVAIPYVYFMKGQRAIINHFSPGFSYDFDRHLNGGSFKVDEHGKIVGNFNIEGAIDLQNRFVVYNMGTLMYREAYDYAARRLRGEHPVLYGDPDPSAPHKKKTALDNAGMLLKWMARSVVKGGIYMTPTVPFFWITRTPQTKHRGVFINPKGRIIDGAHTGAEILSYYNLSSKPEIIHANELPPQGFDRNGHAIPRVNSGTGMTPETRVYWAHYAPNAHSGPDEQFSRVQGEYFESRKVNPIAKDHPAPFNPHAESFGPVDGIFNAAGQMNYKTAYALDPVAQKMGKWLRRNPRIDHAVRTALSLKPGESLTRFTHPFVYASASYTPYMYMKAELARQWDTGKMDAATERMIDGAAKLNWGEFKAGVGEVCKTILHRPFDDPAREATAQKRLHLDRSMPAGVNRGSDYHPRHRHAKSDGGALSWRERVVQGKPEDKPEIGANKPKSYAEQEEMRKALETLAPPTNSVH